ncbi:MAG: MFS transporter [Anaerolineales bacterium]|uniref:MFS transporter n=1 Tax=Candidatus Villigracilis proximus TaxID=3140683 RepID=UPI0031349755|nr:MFS transporter [Anaerolineales bacterium]
MTGQPNRYKWYILTLSILTNMFVVAIPAMGMSVLAKEIAQDLHLNLVQIGMVWGIGSLPAIFISLISGAVGDKVGPKRVLIVSSLLGGLLGATRGLTDNFFSLSVVVILLGALIPFVSINTIKIVGQWFPPHQLGLANGLISMGMALGFLLGSLLSATTFSPLLGGWRNVMIAYGVIGALFSAPWFFVRTLPSHHHAAGQNMSMRAAVSHVLQLKNVWLLGFTLFGVGGCIQGVLGYLPTYLRDIGWEAVRADGALSAFHTISMIFVLPVAIWSDKLNARKYLLLLAALMVALGAGLLSFASGVWIWAAVLMAGFVRDAFMAIYLTMVIEVDGVGPVYAGTATGFTMAISGLGNFVAPPLGNSLAVLWPGAPFALWAGLAVLGMVCLSLVKEGSAKVGSLVLENAL